MPVPKQKGQADSVVSCDGDEAVLGRESFSELVIIRKCLPADLSDELAIRF